MGACQFEIGFVLPRTTRVLDNPSHEIAEAPSRVLCQLRNERGPCHAGLRVDLKANQLARSTGVSSKRKSARDTPRHPSERRAARSVFPEQLVNIW